MAELTADKLPLCPTCLDRVAAWNAAACPGCNAPTPVAECDRCGRRRAGTFVDVGAKHGGQRFACIECMEEVLEQEVTNRRRDAVTATALTILSIVLPDVVHWTFNPWITIALFVATGACLGLWLVAIVRRSTPRKRRAGVHATLARHLLRKKPGKAAALS